MSQIVRMTTTETLSGGLHESKLSDLVSLCLRNARVLSECGSELDGAIVTQCLKDIPPSD
jgi:hypothetical protein